jgi:TP901 family phage tail tape measure protein
MPGQVRSVVVRLSAETSGYIAGISKAEGANAGLERSIGRIETKSLGADRAMRKIGTAGKYIGVAAVGGLALAVKTAADFNSEMATVATLSHASASQVDLLAQSAKTSGVAIGVSAIDAAKAEQELVKAGISVRDILGGGLKGALDLAAAGQTDVASATEIAASAMTQFSLKGKDVPHIADLLAAGADKALGSVTDLGYGLSQVGTTADQMGYHIEGTVGTLAEFAQAGLTGERGGTTFKQMLLQLAAPTKQASLLMKQYGLSLYDTNGQIKPLPELAGNLQKSFEGLDPATRNAALGVIFGSRAIQGANILIKDGEAGNRKWIRSVNDQGFAAHQASGKLDSLKGDFSKLKAAAVGGLIDLGSGSQSPLRGLVQNTTDEINKLTKNHDLERWGRKVGHSVQEAIDIAGPLAKDVGGALGTVADGVGRVVSGFNKLPDGVRKAILTGGVVAAGAHKLGLDSAIKGIGKSVLGTAAKGVVPVYVTNKGFGSPGDLLPDGKPGEPVPTGKPRGVGGKGGGFLTGLASLFTGPAAAVGGLGLGVTFGASHGEVGERLKPIVDKGVALKQQAKEAKRAADSQKDLNDLLNVGTKVGKTHTKSVKDLGDTLGHTGKETSGLAAATQGATAGAEQGKSAFSSFFKGITGGPSKKAVKVTAPGLAPADTGFKGLFGSMTKLPSKKSTRVSAPGAATAKADVQGLAAAIAGLHDKSITVHVAKTGANVAGLVGSSSARGNMFAAKYANGDIRNGHAPEYAKPTGLARVWLEDETMGESYIPHANDARRPRARSILDQTARLFGGRVSYNADGSFVPGKDAADLNLADLQLRQQIADDQRDLDAKHKKGPKKGKHVLKDGSLARAITQADHDDAVLALQELRGQAQHDLDEANTSAQADAAAALTDAITSSTTALSGGEDIFGRGSSPSSVINSVNRLVADISGYGQTIASLRQAGASPALLKLVKAKAESGDFKSATRLGKALLAQPLLLGQLNASLASLDTVSGSVATYTNDPAFTTSGATLAAPATAAATYVSNFYTDPSTLMQEVDRRIEFKIQSTLSGQVG